MSRTIFVLGYVFGLLLTITTHAAEPVDIGSRRELFIDSFLVDKMIGKAEFRLHAPIKREVAIKYDESWEGNASGYATIFQDGDIYRMYYRGHRYIVDGKKLKQAQSEVVCYAESKDGINWNKPKLNLFAWKGSKENNIIWLGGPETHNFAPFKDTNPNCKPDEIYKAIGGTVTSKGLLTFKSKDGIHWKKLSDRPVVTKGAFDSHNTCFWDVEQKRYIMYVRYFDAGQFKGLRSIGVSYSTDFTNWTEPVGIIYPNSPPQQMYTNQIGPYIRAPHILMGFPTRYVAKTLNEHGKQLDPVTLRNLLTKTHTRLGTDLTDGVFMTSRDGQAFRRWDEAFLRPGPQSAGHWIYGDNYQSYGLWETASPEGTNEISMHFTEYAWLDAKHQSRRYTIRLDGFVSLNAPLSGGELLTKPLLFSGKKLSINYSTSALGSLRVELQDADRKPITGYGIDDCLEHYGDSVQQTIAWKNGTDLSALAGKPVRLKFVLKDADLYSFQFVE